MIKKLKEFLGLKKNMTVLMAMVILVGMGEKMAERFLPIYLLALGGGVLSVGLLNGLDNLLSALYSFPGGYVADRIGYKKALFLFNVIALAGFLIVILFPFWQAVIIGSFFFLSWTAISLPATIKMISSVLPSNKHTMGVTMHSLVRRVPMALGPIVGSLFITFFGVKSGVRLSFAFAFALGLISLVFQQFFIEADKKRVVAEKNPLSLISKMPRQMKKLLLSDILIRFCEQIPYAFVVVWCIHNIGVTPVQFVILTAIEMVTAVLIYIPVAYLADKGKKKPLVAITFFNFTIFPIFLLISKNYFMLIIAFIIRGLKEFGEPTRKTLIMQLSPTENKAGLFGLYYLIRDVIVSLAAFGGAFLWNVSPQVNFITASAFGIIGTIYFLFSGLDA